MFQDLSGRSIQTGFLADLRRGSNSLNSDTGDAIIEEENRKIRNQRDGE